MKIASIRPLSAVPPDLVRGYLCATGIPAALVEWKYFDGQFNNGRERGYVWFHENQVQGFLGLIPFSLKSRGKCVPATWTCDWSVRSPERNPGVGVLLYQRALSENSPLLTLGGNAISRALLPRMAQSVIEGASLLLKRPLSWAAVWRKMRSRLPDGCSPRLSFLERVKWSCPAESRDGRYAIVTKPGSPAASLSPIPVVGEPELAPAYDAGFLKWQLERCPAIRTTTTYCTSENEGAAAATYWRASDNQGQWKLALLGNSAGPTASAALDEAVRMMIGDGGQIVSTLVGSGDREQIGMLRRHGFRVRDRLPLFISYRGDATPWKRRFAGISFLDSDLGYRFDAPSPALAT